MVVLSVDDQDLEFSLGVSAGDEEEREQSGTGQTQGGKGMQRVVHRGRA